MSHIVRFMVRFKLQNVAPKCKMLQDFATLTCAFGHTFNFANLSIFTKLCKICKILKNYALMIHYWCIIVVYYAKLWKEVFPDVVLKAAFHWSPSRIRTLLYPQRTSNFVNRQAPFNLSSSSLIRGRGYAFLIVCS